MDLSTEQMFILTIIVIPLLTQGIKLYAAKMGHPPSRTAITIIAFVISLGLGYWWMLPKLPTFEDPMTSALQLVTVIGSLLGFATLIYNVILDKIFEKFNLTKDRFEQP